VVIRWFSPIVGQLEADGTRVGKFLVIPKHPLTGKMVLIPKEWEIVDGPFNLHA